jgi:hypothetical protein
LAERRRLPKASKSIIERLELGMTKNVDPQTLRSLADLYGQPYEILALAFVKSRFGIGSLDVTAMPLEPPRPAPLPLDVARAAAALEAIEDPEVRSSLAAQTWVTSLAIVKREPSLERIAELARISIAAARTTTGRDRRRRH